MPKPRVYLEGQVEFPLVAMKRVRAQASETNEHRCRGKEMGLQEKLKRSWNISAPEISANSSERSQALKGSAYMLVFCYFRMKDLVFLFQVYSCIVCMHVCVHGAYKSLKKESGPLNWSYRQMWAIM